MRWTIALRIAPAVGVCCSLWLGAGESRAVASPPVPVPEVAPVPPPPLADDDGAAGDPAVEKLAQAENFAARRDWNQAIAVLTEVIDSPAAPETLRNDARQRRADAYLTRRKAGDFALALADRRAVGEPGLYVQVAATNATLQRGRNTTGRLRRGEIILISAIKGDWY
ncbi:MAG TPA: hypothetical protein VGE52_18815, partial [Pirellulales bacterium]